MKRIRDRILAATFSLPLLALGAAGCDASRAAPVTGDGGASTGTSTSTSIGTSTRTNGAGGSDGSVGPGGAVSGSGAAGGIYDLGGTGLITGSNAGGLLDGGTAPILVDGKIQCVPPWCIPASTSVTTGTATATATGKKKPGGGGSGPTVIGVPTVGVSTGALPGGGVASSATLAPGCTPASADECPTVSGACSTSASAQPTSVQFGELCLYGDVYSVTSATPAATVEYLRETVNGQTYYRFRVTFPTSFVDSTYGTASVGWGKRGHWWKDLVGSDHAELQLFDQNRQMVLHFKMDFISADASQPSGYGTLGVSGGDGSMLVGDSKYILAVGTSLTRNLNGCGYVTNSACGGDCRTNSPATDDKYTPNPDAPSWDFRAQYDVWVDAAAFGSAGFGGANISYVHASPAKTEQDTIIVTPGPCPPPPGGCPPGSVQYITAEGASSCIPTTTTATLTSTGTATYTTFTRTGTATGTSTSVCPPGSEEYITAEGASMCIPTTTTATLTGTGTGTGTGTSTSVCPPGSEEYITSEGAPNCTPIPQTNPSPGTGPCPPDYTLYLTSEGASHCVPIPDEAGICPKGYKLDPTSEGKRCI